MTSKSYELPEYEKLPARIIYMPLGFGESVHRPLLPASRETFMKYSSDVSFLGGWEPRRERLLDEVAGVPGVRLNVWGYGWDHLQDGRLTPRRFFAMRRNSGGEPFTVRRNARLAATVRGGEVYGDEYAWAISTARISLGFLRKICPDQHTTRTFEIPACGSMLLADRTQEHKEFYEEGVEAEFFESKAELLDKLGYYLENERARAAVALRGYQRCLSGGYSYHGRMTKVLESVGK
ncbi:MAG: CgeB family protein [Gemmatimonadaceae bacterium]